MSEQKQIHIVPSQATEPDEMKSFLLVVRRALLLIVGYIETKYRIERKRG